MQCHRSNADHSRRVPARASARGLQSGATAESPASLIDMLGVLVHRERRREPNVATLPPFEVKNLSSSGCKTTTAAANIGALCKDCGSGESSEVSATGLWVDASAVHPQYLAEIYEPRMAEATWRGASIATL
jgi:hypothetical protein